MDPLEEKIRKQFALIKTGSKKLLETDIIHSIEVKEKIAYIQLLFSSEQLNSQQQKDLQKKISSALLKLKEIEDIRFSKSTSSEEAQNINQGSKLHKIPKPNLQKYLSICALNLGIGTSPDPQYETLYSLSFRKNSIPS